jgi:hypothetical protein
MIGHHAADAEWDAGDMGCGELVLELYHVLMAGGSPPMMETVGRHASARVAEAKLAAIARAAAVLRRG